MKALLKLSTTLAGIGLAMMMSQMALGQAGSSPQATAVEPSISKTTLTVRSHQIGAGNSAGNLEGQSCAATDKMISGACHPFYNDRVIIINQWPNIGANTWRCGFKNNTNSTKTVWVYTLCAAPEGLPDIVEHRLQIRRYTTTNLTNADADMILADATTVLQQNDGPGDVACATALVRDGDVTVFTTGDGSIDSGTEFSAVIGLPGHIKAVNQINWCGGLVPNVIGCAPVPGNSLAVVRFTASLEGILWAHEYGHNKGLSHRNDTNAVMNPTIGSTRLRVNSTECNAYRTLPLVALASETVMPQVAESSPMSVRDFVRQIFIHGVPYEEASKYSSSAISTLQAMLNDPAEEAHWANIVVVLGMIGDESAVEPLITFVEADDERGLSRAHYVAKTSAVISMGYLINKTGNQRALDFLKEGVKPQAWAATKVGVAPFQRSTTERDFDFSKSAVLGLALSGHPDAAETLRLLQQPADSDMQRAFQAQVGDLISEALKENEKIAEQGLADYYRTTRP